MTAPAKYYAEICINWIHLQAGLGDSWHHKVKIHSSSVSASMFKGGLHRVIVAVWPSKKVLVE